MNQLLPTYSVIIPCYNEEDNLQPLLDSLLPVLEDLNQPFEIIFVDDTSTDNTINIITTLKNNHPQIRVICLQQHQGQSIALLAGIESAQAETIITIDADLQNDPNDIPTLIEQYDGYDMVCGIRIKRKDPWHRKLAARIANNVRHFFTNDGIKDSGCTLKVFSKTCFMRIPYYKGMHRFLPTLFTMVGFRVKQVPVNHRPRQYGKSKYGIFNRLFITMVDLFAVRWLQSRYPNYQKKEID